MEIPTFYAGDTITVDLDLRDEGGVGYVAGVFAHVNPGVPVYGDPASYYEDIRLSGDGKGQAGAMVVVTGKVEETTASGEYVCRYVQGYDARGSYRTFHPRPAARFRVENRPEDLGDPDLRCAGAPNLRRPWWRRLFPG